MGHGPFDYENLLGTLTDMLIQAVSVRFSSLNNLSLQ